MKTKQEINVSSPRIFFKFSIDKDGWMGGISMPHVPVITDLELVKLMRGGHSLRT